MGLSSRGFYVSKKTQTHTQKEGTLTANRAGNSEINVSIGAGLNLHYEEIISEL